MTLIADQDLDVVTVNGRVFIQQFIDHDDVHKTVVTVTPDKSYRIAEANIDGPYTMTIVEPPPPEYPPYRIEFMDEGTYTAFIAGDEAVTLNWQPVRIPEFPHLPAMWHTLPGAQDGVKSLALNNHDYVFRVIDARGEGLSIHTYLSELPF